MSELTELPNIGTTLSEKLHQVGIHTSEQLKEVGSENAIIRISTIHNSGVCINMLYALEGAIQGKRWHKLSGKCKAELKESYIRLF